MVQVRRAVEVPPLPAGPVLFYGLGLYGAFPGLDLLLLGTYVLHESEAGREGTGEATSFGFEHGEEAFYHQGLHKHVVVEKEHRLGLRTREEEVALLGDAACLSMVPLGIAATR